MKYDVRIKKNVTKKIKKIPKNYIPKIYSSIKSLSENPRPDNCKKLQGPNEIYRIRIGVYRLLYSIDDTIQIVDIEKLMHRQDGY